MCRANSKDFTACPVERTKNCLLSTVLSYCRSGFHETASLGIKLTATATQVVTIIFLKPVYVKIEQTKLTQRKANQIHTCVDVNT